ncbi:DUF2062 domain-containing protein [Tunicatimonas pelagia]|uniref:DUF2062 domain-containing protein n=1 Tax=Tunicatimonas pelagia TaxID=931531 RepID=UPI0026665C9D|nr:DUF2062 domain-containing protein [Tunicatimonas pelagia]WKN45283.1 DUF2062 domain-containing protein [Tunicatimonas pelagia]
MNQYISTKSIRQVREVLSRGATPRELSLAIALSVPMGIVPVFGFTTPLATVIAMHWKLNVPLVLALLYLALPLQLLLFVPFLRMGELLFQLAPLPFSPSEIMSMLETTGWGLFQQIWVTNLAGIAVWLLVAIPLGALLYQISLLISRRFLSNSGEAI